MKGIIDSANLSPNAANITSVTFQEYNDVSSHLINVVLDVIVKSKFNGVLENNESALRASNLRELCGL